jgi:arylamine N-acetyltransferase
MHHLLPKIHHPLLATVHFKAGSFRLTARRWTSRRSGGISEKNRLVKLKSVRNECCNVIRIPGLQVSIVKECIQSLPDAYFENVDKIYFVNWAYGSDV